MMNENEGASPIDSEIRPCCHESSCPRADMIRFTTPDNPIENDVDAIASAVAVQCPGLDRGALESCFSRWFEMPSQCRLFDRFSASYSAERIPKPL